LPLVIINTLVQPGGKPAMSATQETPPKQDAEARARLVSGYSDILSRQLSAPTSADEDEDEDEPTDLPQEEDPVPGEFAAEHTVVRFPTDEDDVSAVTDEDAGEVNRLDSPPALAG
jgi:hypothetical protein